MPRRRRVAPENGTGAQAGMADISASAVKELRELTGAGFMDCKRALEETAGDVAKAVVLLRERGQAAAAKKADREAREGLISSYIHTGGRIGVLIEVNCETDFVAKGEDFRKLAKELALQVAASNPRWVSRDEVPDEVLVSERVVFEAKAQQEGKPEHVIAKVVENQVENFIKENCLLEQPHWRDPKTTVQDLIAENISKLQENIVIRRFARFNVREA
jgi:elongation factor Ts